VRRDNAKIEKKHQPEKPTSGGRNRQKLCEKGGDVEKGRKEVNRIRKSKNKKKKETTGKKKGSAGVDKREMCLGWTDPKATRDRKGGKLKRLKLMAKEVMAWDERLGFLGVGQLKVHGWGKRRGNLV